jgi:hypothetical protein
MSTEVVSTFDSSMYVTELLARSLENSALDVTHRAVTALAAKYGFSAEEAIADLGLSKLSLTKKQMAKKGSKGEKAPKVKVAKAEKSAFMLPFCGTINEQCCPGLQFNGGLFTQCKHARGNCESGFCKKCGEQAEKNASGVPDCGTVGQRLAAEPMEFRDPKGRAPISYAKYMEKKSISVEQVTEAAEKLGWVVPEVHFAAPVKKTKVPKAAKGGDDEAPKKRGRPKKDAKVVEASSVDDLFATLAAEAASPKSTAVANSQENVVEAASSSDDESTGSSEKKATKAKKPKMSDAEKAAAKEAKEAEKLAAKLAKELEAKQAKMAKEAEKAAAKEAKEAEKLAAKEAKEAEKAAAKAAKDAEKASKPKAAKAPKAEKSTEAAAAEPAKKKVTVTPFTFEGKNYVRSAEGIVYDLETKEDIGMWNEATKEVEFFAEDGELSEEEEDDE